MRYDDLADLDMYDGLDDIGLADGMPSAAALQRYVLAAGAGAGALLLGTWLMPKVPAPKDWQELNAHRMRAAIAALAGLTIGHFTMRYNRDVGMAVLGGISGLAIAQLVGSLVTPNFVGTPFGQLSADDEYSMMGAIAGDEDAAAALSALETATVAGSRPVFGGFEGPTVSRQALMGDGSSLEAAMVQPETLGNGEYPAYLS